MKKILIIDIETTGFVPEQNFIVEIGIVSLDLDNGNIETLFDKVVRESGMTKEEVILARGHPPFHKTRSLELDKWKFWYMRLTKGAVHFENGKVARIQGRIQK